MGLLRIAFAGAVGYGLYRYATKDSHRGEPAAFAEGEATGGPNEVRNAGPAAMRSDQPNWDHVDESSDESFPASDPPAVHRST